MGRPKKYKGLHDRNKKYHSTKKGFATLKKYQNSEHRKAKQRERMRAKRGTIVDKQQWFIDTYGEIDKALELLDERTIEVIVKIYGLDGNHPVKQKDIAAEWGTKPQWISEIKVDGMDILDAAVKAGKIGPSSGDEK